MVTISNILGYDEYFKVEAEIVGILLQLLTLVLTSITILILIWDHIKDGINLKRQVQEFYEDIENFIFSFYQRDYYLKYSSKINEESKDILMKFVDGTEYYGKKVSLNYQDYSKYLGIILCEKRYLSIDMISVTINGFIYFNHKMYTNGKYINNETIELIKRYLKNLRYYWNRNYSKFLLRPKIKERQDFKELKGYLEPIIEENGKWIKVTN